MTGPWRGGVVSPRATCVLAPNPGPMTLEGTNTWVLSEPGADTCVVVDPGPLDQRHLDAVALAVALRGRRVGLVLLTHRHADHAEAAEQFSGMTGAPVRAQGAGDLSDGDILRVADLELAVVATPGHTRDSVSFLVPAEDLLLTGDTVLGRGTSVVAWPDGELAAYLASLERLAGMTASGQVSQILPGHGPVVPDPESAVRFYLEHRRARLAQVRKALAAGAHDADAVVATVYADVPRQVWPAARLTVLAQLDYLRSAGGPSETAASGPRAPEPPQR